jgi:hypothetical protein
MEQEEGMYLNDILHDISHRLGDIERHIFEVREEQQRNQEAILTTSYVKLRKALEKNPDSLSEIIEEDTYPIAFIMRIACRKGDKEMIEKFIKEGIDPNEDCMEAAVKYNHMEIIELLHKHNCPRYRLRNLTIACEYGNLDIVKFFHETIDEPLNNNLLVPAVVSKNYDLVKYLILKGLTFDERLVELAAFYQQKKIQRMLEQVLKIKDEGD